VDGDIRVTSWNELNEALFAESWKPNLERFRSNFAYRGMPDTAQELCTSLTRLGADYGRRETPLLRTFRRYALRYGAPGDSIWNWMAIGQHHGLPTRLLDWTYSPFVALHFATDDVDHFNVDGVVWCMDYVKAAEVLPDKLKQILKDEGANVFTTEMLSRAAGSVGEFDRLSDRPFVAFLEPPSLDDRIVNQFALFSLMSSPTAQLTEWLATRPDLAHRVILPAELKWEVRDKLDQGNITERVLFPGMDGLSRWLKRYYTARVSGDK
jgi:hypothetical protein